MANERNSSSQSPGQKQNEKLPWNAGLEVKDLVKPITVRRTRMVQISALVILIAIIGGVLWMQFLKPPSGEKLVADMIEASGGTQAWNLIRAGQFLRTHIVYDEKGVVIDKEEETFYFKNTSHGTQLMIKSHTSDGDDVVIGRDDENKYWGIFNGTPGEAKVIAKKMEYMCHDDGCDPLCSAEMAFYRFSMPFKLSDSGVIPKYAGTAILNGEKAMLLDVTFDPKVGSDRWVYYVNPSTKLIRKIEHYSSKDSNQEPAEIYWSDFKKEGHITIAHSNKYYRSNGKILEEYNISSVDFNADFADDFFHKPAQISQVNN